MNSGRIAIPTNPGIRCASWASLATHSDDDLGLDLLGCTHYDPVLGRFITQDPSRDGLDWYAYCGNNPVAGTDPTGLREQKLTDTQVDYFAAALTVFGEMGGRWARTSYALVTMAHEGRIAYDPDLEDAGQWKMLPYSHIVIGKRAFVAYQDFDTVMGLCRVLAHEYTHSRQLALYTAFHPNGCELDAYQVEMDFNRDLAHNLRNGNITLFDYGVNQTKDFPSAQRELEMLREQQQTAVDDAKNQLRSWNFPKLKVYKF